MYTMKKSIGILALALVVFIILFSSIIFSNSNLFTTGKTCSQTWNQTCNVTTLDDCFKGSGGLNGTQINGCNGTQMPQDSSWPYVSEVYINASSFIYGDGINVTCEFIQNVGGFTYFEYVWYYNSSNWINVQNWTNATDFGTTPINRSVAFNLNSSEGTHIVRCILSFNQSSNSNQGRIPNECANITYSDFYDNDDVNFTVTSHLTYDFWNLTNYTTGINIGSGGAYYRNNSLNVSVHWSKEIDSAWIEHNGNGSFVNYSICSNCQRTWTNYTLNLSNSTEFNSYNTTIKAIHVNDTYGLENSTSPELSFNLNPGDLPSINTIYLYRLSTQYGSTASSNLFDYNFKIVAEAKDDVGLSSVTANVTYPLNGISFNVTMEKNGYNGEWELWKVLIFNSTFPMNQTGDYLIRVTAKDIGGQENSSDETAILTVYNDYDLAPFNSHDIYMRGENVSIQASSHNGYEPELGGLNWTYNVTKVNETLSSYILNSGNIFNYTIQTDDPEGNYSIYANASKYCDTDLECNSGNYTFEFSVSNNLTVNISSSDSTPSKKQQLNIALTVYNARGEPYTNEVSANVSCRNSSYQENITYLNFTGGNTLTICYAPNADSYPFSIVINISDDYNNTGRNHLVLTTEALATITYSGGGSGGFSTSAKEKPKNCSDGTLYDQCSSKLPYYCSNGTLTPKCSRCGCYNSSYSCQPSGSCALVREEDFNFTINKETIEMKQGETSKDTDIECNLKNTGVAVLSLNSFLNVSENCCNVSMPASFTLNPKEEKKFSIIIHVPLSANVGRYLVKIGIGTERIKKERTFDLVIEESLHRNSLLELESQIKDIENKIQEVKNSGIDTRNLEAMVEKSKALLQNANSSIASDQIDVLSASLANLTTNNQLVTSRLGGLRTQAFLLQNAWLITLFVIMSFTTMYMVPQVLLPLNKKENELKELKEEEEALVISRVETEKQYFMRKIDENTFSKIMISRQDRILKVRAQIREREGERTQLIKAVSPLAMATWFVNGIKGMPQKIKNSPKSILNRKNKNNIDSNGKTQ